jgi:cell division transport system permease protein
MTWSPFSPLRRAIGNLRQAAVASLITAGIIAMCLFLIGGYLVLAHNLGRARAGWERQVGLTAWMAEGVSREAASALVVKVSLFPETERADYVGREAALAEFRDMMGDDARALAGLTDLPLPASIRVTLKPPFRNRAGVESVVARLAGESAIADLTWGREWLARAESLARLLTLGGAALGAALALSAVFIIANTIKLTVLARRDELETMRLVGATEGFIRFPFFLEGLLQGLAGGAAALLALAAMHRALAGQLSLFAAPALLIDSIEFLPAGAAASLVLGGMALGAFGSLAAVGRAPRR